MTDAIDPNQPVYSIEKIYVKDLSLEIPNAPQIFLEREAPNVDVQLHHASTKVDEGVFQTELTLTVTANLAESGPYRMFIQFQTAGTLHTAALTISAS